MGAEVFFHSASGKTAKQAFRNAVDDAAYEFGHGGYTGSIAEKGDFTMCSDRVFESYDEAETFANDLIDKCDKRVDDKWGPAGCVKFKSPKGDVNYLFFGWASS